ncbi:MAG: hypothetical protein MUO41_04725, partial [Methyloceanibacter sp.]|nr:hypothetical protein [Methyloceanibacter sp.]
RISSAIFLGAIAVEMSFYLIAPILVLLASRRIWPLGVLAVLATLLFVYATLVSAGVVTLAGYYV